MFQKAILAERHSVKKNGRKDLHYVPQRDCKEGAGTSGVARIPAAELEAAVMHQLQQTIRAPNLATEIAERAQSHDKEIDEAKVTVALTHYAHVWEQIFLALQSRIANSLVERVEVLASAFDIRLRPNGLKQLETELKA